MATLPGDNRVWWVELPPGGGPPVRAYVNGTEITEGAGLEVRDGRVWFDPPLRARPDLGFGRKVMLAIGIGVYGDLKGDSVDLWFVRDGRTEVLNDLRPSPTPPPPGRS